MYQVSVNDSEAPYSVELKKGSATEGTINGNPFDLDVVKIKEGNYSVIHNNKSYNVELVKTDFETKEFRIKLNDQVYTANIKDRFDLLLEELGLDNLNNVTITDIKAPMPGLVLEAKVKVGDTVAKGDPVLILEAMKMENVLKSPTDGVIKSIIVKSGDAVEKNQILIHFE
ncbi:MAG: biotin carboxyl carrier protein [Sphingobacteriales bacterium]|jgi:biotin carboxyl carrier protein